MSGKWQDQEKSKELLTTYLEQFITHLWRGGEYGHFRSFPCKLSDWVRVGDPLPSPRNGQNVFFGVNPVREIPPTNSKGKKVSRNRIGGQNEYIAVINCVYSDFDGKNFDKSDPTGRGKELALEAIERLELQPSALIDSGGGYQPYWLLDEPFRINGNETRERATRLLEGWVAYVGADPKVHDLARILRVPGTRNLKSKYGPDFPTVEWVEYTPDLTYTIEELEERLPPMPVVETGKGETTQPSTNDGDIVQRRKHWTRALETITQMIRATRDSEKHNTLLRAARLLGGYLAGGMGNEEDAIRLLESEIEKRPNVESMDAARATIADGIAYGKNAAIPFEQLERERREWADSLYKFELGNEVHAQANDGAVLASGEVANRRHRKEDGEWVNLYRIGDDRAEYSEPMLSGGLRDLTPRTEPTPETEYTLPPEPEWGEPEGATELYEPVALLSLADILADTTPVPPDIVTGMLPGKAAVLLSAPGGDGKSYVTLDLCMCVPRGVGWLGLDTYSTGVLVIDLENRKLRFRERLKRCMHGHSLTKPPAVHVTFELNTRLDGDAIIDEIAQLADDCGAGLVILDSLVDFLGETEENSNAEMGRVANRLRAIADAVGGLLVIHHTPKASGATPRGATALRNGIDVNIILSREGNVITLKQDKNRCGPEQFVTARMNWSDGLFNLSPLNVTVGRDEIERKTKSDPDEKAILNAVDDAAGGWVKSADVVNYAVEQPDTNKRRTIQNKLKALIRDEVLEKMETANGVAYLVRRNADRETAHLHSCAVSGGSSGAGYENHS